MIAVNVIKYSKNMKMIIIWSKKVDYSDKNLRVWRKEGEIEALWVYKFCLICLLFYPQA